jgi:hypothetical protein
MKRANVTDRTAFPWKDARMPGTAWLLFEVSELIIY